MRIIQIILILSLAEIFAGPKKKAAKSNRIKINDFQTVFFTDISTEMDDFKVSGEVIGYWDPTVGEIKMAEDVIKQEMNTKPESKSVFELDSANKRQYWGIYDSSGAKELHIVYIKDPMNKVKSWDKAPFWSQGDIGHIDVRFDVRKMTIGATLIGGKDFDRINKMRMEAQSPKTEI